MPYSDKRRRDKELGEKIFISQEEQDINALISVLQAAKNSFSMSVSPVIPLLDGMIELSLILAKQLRNGAWLTSQPNSHPDIKERVIKDHDYYEFGLKRGDRDPLGNVRSITIKTPGKFVKNPELAYWFQRLASILVNIKKKAPEKDFMSFLKKISLVDAESEGVAVKKKRTKKSKARTYHYHRRHQRN